MPLQEFGKVLLLLACFFGVFHLYRWVVFGTSISDADFGGLRWRNLAGRTQKPPARYRKRLRSFETKIGTCWEPLARYAVPGMLLTGVLTFCLFLLLF